MLSVNGGKIKHNFSNKGRDKLLIKLDCSFDKINFSLSIKTGRSSSDSLSD